MNPPFQFDPNSNDQAHYFLAAGRLKPGVTPAQANAQMKLAANEFGRRYPQTNPQQGFSVQPLRDTIVSDGRSSLLVLVGAVSFVLLIACANVAQPAAGARNRTQAGVRDSRRHGCRLRESTIRQLLTESVLLSLVGGALGLILGFVGVRALLAVSPGGIPRIGENGAAVGIDWRVLAFTLGVSVFTGILFGLFPALSASSPDLNSTLEEKSTRRATGFRQSKARSLLVISEVSLALVLLIGAALLIRTFIALRGVNPGFNPHNVLTMEMSLTGDPLTKTAGVAQMVRDGRERLRAIPGSGGFSFHLLPAAGGRIGLPFIVVGRPLGKDSATGGAGGRMNASPGYFDVYISSPRPRFHRSGRGRRPRGGDHEPRWTAKKFWPKEDPVGQQIIIGKGVGPEFEEPRGRSSASSATFATAVSIAIRVR